MKGAISAIVLAAGASRRLGRPKQLLMDHGETLLARTVRLAAEAGAAPVVVVLGAGHERILETVRLGEAVVVINEDWEQGVSTSLRAGLNASDAIDPQTEGALILTCDQPRLNLEHLRALKSESAAHARSTIVASAYADVLGVPVLFPRGVFPDLHALRGDKGARVLLLAPPCAVVGVPFSGGEVDIDEPEDMAQLL